MIQKINFNISKKWNKPIYITNKKRVDVDDYNNEIVIYDTPFKLGLFNYQPIIGQDLYSYINAFGVTKNKLVRLYLDIKYKNSFKEEDLAYLYGATPTGETVNGANANYKVKTFVEQNTKIYVVFEEIIKEVS